MNQWVVKKKWPQKQRNKTKIKIKSKHNWRTERRENEERGRNKTKIITWKYYVGEETQDRRQKNGPQNAGKEGENDGRECRNFEKSEMPQNTEDKKETKRRKKSVRVNWKIPQKKTENDKTTTTTTDRKREIDGKEQKKNSIRNKMIKQRTDEWDENKSWGEGRRERTKKLDY